MHSPFPGMDPYLEVPTIWPDVSLTTPREATGTPSAVAVAEPLPVRLRVPLDIPTRLVTVYIRQRENETLVAVLELLSPVNKRHGTGRMEYLEKRRAYLRTRIHLHRDRSPA